ncbi:MAG: sulfotransferase domain-containing protein [Candidatus Aminicenantes bacterium]|nr:sulfotransferase domain-containing protein [Candidatus Aminicenantes bacterium]
MENQAAPVKEEIRPKVLKNGIFVVGHPRSGTSLACQLLKSAGVDFPSDFGADEYNKSGYFELQTGKELEKKLIDKAMTEENVIELNKIVERLNKGSGLTGLKIVHVPALFFFRHIAKDKKMRVVFIFRNPADVKSSMYKRGISQFKLSWFENNNALVAAHENIPKSIVISYEALLGGHPGIGNAFKKLGFTVDTAVIRKEEQTQKNSRIVLGADEMKLYKLLRKLEKKSYR